MIRNSLFLPALNLCVLFSSPSALNLKKVIDANPVIFFEYLLWACVCSPSLFPHMQFGSLVVFLASSEGKKEHI